MNHTPLPRRPHPARIHAAITTALQRLADEIRWHHIRTNDRDNQH